MIFNNIQNWFSSFLKEECKHRGYGTKIKQLLECSIKKVAGDHGEIRITAVEMIGGNTRVPFVQKIIESVFKRKPFATLNAEEVIARGCGLWVSAFGFLCLSLKLSHLKSIYLFKELTTFSLGCLQLNNWLRSYYK